MFYNKLKKTNLFRNLFHYYKYKNFKPKNYLSIVAIAKNEATYIAEWIEFHKLVGVEKFYIYDNESDDNLCEVLASYIQSGVVDYHFCPGKVMQEWAYNDILETACKETYWLAMIDLDEFIVPIEKATVPMILKDFESFGGLGVHWLIYGSAGKDKMEDGLVLERFKDHSEVCFSINIQFKSIVNPRWVSKIGIHNCVYSKGYCVNENYEKIEGEHYGDRITAHKIRINHYFTKSKEEFLKKRERGRATMQDVKRVDEHFEIHDRNEIKNDTIMDKYIKIIKTELMNKGTNGIHGLK